MLLLIKQEKVIYTGDLVPKLKVCRRTIYNLLRLYDEGGLEGMITIRQRGGIPPWITEQTKQAIASMLANPTTTITSCVELLAWVHKNYQSNTSDQVLYKHCRKHHNSTLKVSRKSHYKKDKDAERTFKEENFQVNYVKLKAVHLRISLTW